LQRRLTEQGITFQQLLDEARRELAHHYLLHSSRELNETAYLLGYADANSFFRAFHHWEGTTPGQWRVLQKTSRSGRQSPIGAAWADMEQPGALLQPECSFGCGFDTAAFICSATRL